MARFAGPPFPRFAYNATMTNQRLSILAALFAIASVHVARAADDDTDRSRETSLSDVVQLTSGFDRAGEAYFSPDANWIVFQATPKGEKHYAMYAH